MELKNMLNRTNAITFGLGAAAVVAVQVAFRFGKTVVNKTSSDGQQPDDSSLHYRIMSELQQAFEADAITNKKHPGNVDIYEVGFDSADKRLKGMKVYEIIVYKAFTYNGQALADVTGDTWPTVYRTLTTGQGQAMADIIEVAVGGGIYRSIVDIETGFWHE
jgi:hypothetical protein